MFRFRKDDMAIEAQLWASNESINGYNLRCHTLLNLRENRVIREIPPAISGSKLSAISLEERTNECWYITYFLSFYGNFKTVFSIFYGVFLHLKNTFRNFRKKYFWHGELWISQQGKKFAFPNKSHSHFMILWECNFLRFFIFAFSMQIHNSAQAL